MLFRSAHPTMVAGHPFKGSWVYSTGQLLHPDLKRFSLQTAVLFKPVFPGKNPYDHSEHHSVPSFSDFFSAYFGQKTLNISNERCNKLFEGMKKVRLRAHLSYSATQTTSTQTLAMPALTTSRVRREPARSERPDDYDSIREEASYSIKNSQLSQPRAQATSACHTTTHKRHLTHGCNERLPSFNLIRNCVLIYYKANPLFM